MFGLIKYEDSHQEVISQGQGAEGQYYQKCVSVYSNEWNLNFQVNMGKHKPNNLEYLTCCPIYTSSNAHKIN